MKKSEKKMNKKESKKILFLTNLFKIYLII